MLRQPGSKYEVGRSGTLLKAKRFRDGEARVLGHEPGRGRHQGRLGALLVRMADGTRFAVGTGFSDAQRSSPPPVGSLIRFRYQELSDAGVPRFPSFVSLHEDMPTIPKQGELQMPKASVKRRLEFVGGASAKFWEIAVEGKTVRVRFGRLGATGQQETKEFATAEAAAKHADKKIQEKLNKGYAEVG